MHCEHVRESYHAAEDWDLPLECKLNILKSAMRNYNTAQEKKRKAGKSSLGELTMMNCDSKSCNEYDSCCRRAGEDSSLKKPSLNGFDTAFAALCWRRHSCKISWYIASSLSLPLDQKGNHPVASLLASNFNIFTLHVNSPYFALIWVRARRP